MLTTIRHPRGRSLRAFVHLTLAAVAALMLAAGHAAPARAEEPAVSATHQWVSSGKRAGGAYSVTYRFTFTNIGDQDIENFGVQWINDYVGQLLRPGTPIVVGSLAVGQSIAVTAELRSLMRVDANRGADLMIGQGQGSDGFGNTLAIPVVSKGEDS